MQSSLISCPECSCELEVPVESIGTIAECPQCDGNFVVANFLDTETPASPSATHDRPARPVDDGTPSIFESLKESEVDIITDDFGLDKSEITCLKRDKRWECTLLAILVDKQLEKLSAKFDGVTNDTGESSGGGMSRRKYKGFIEEKYYEFLTLYDKLYKLLARELLLAMESEEIKSIEKFNDYTEKLFSALAELHREISHEPAPQEELGQDIKSLLEESLPDTIYSKLYKTPTFSSNPYEDIKQIMAGWAPHCNESMRNVVEHLQEMGNSGRKSELEFTLQFSLIPPTLYQFFKLAANVRIGGHRKRTVYQELSE